MRCRRRAAIRRSRSPAKPRKACAGSICRWRPAAINQRDTLAHPMPDGRAYIELYPDGKPSKEIGLLWRWVTAQLTADHHDRDDETHPRPSAAAGQPAA